MSEWRSMREGEMPKLGQFILVAGRYRAGRYGGAWEMRLIQWKGYWPKVRRLDPSHWMPLPDIPTD